MGIGLIASVWGVGGSLGIVLSGPLVDGISWRSIFAVSAVGVAASLVLVHRYVPESPVKSPSRVDVPGALLLSGLLVSLLLAVTEGEPWGWGSTRVVALFAVAAACAVAWTAVERRSPSPMIDMAVFTQRPVVAANLAAFSIGVTMFSSFVLMPSFVQSHAEQVGYGFGASVMETGVYYFLPGSLLMLGVGPLAGWLGRKPQASKWPLALGMALVALGAAMLALWHAEPWQFMVGNTVFSTGTGFASASLPKLITDSVRPTETGVANGMNMVVRNVGGVVGGQAVAAILLASAFAGTQTPSVDGYVAGFWVLAAAALAGIAVAVLATPGRRVRQAAPAAA
jgi:MFS family permease